MRRSTLHKTPSAVSHARALVRQVCRISADTGWLDDLNAEAASEGVIAAVEDHDTPVIFDWLMWTLSFQGISDAVASGYLARHGNITWWEIEDALTRNHWCGKLEGYWAFSDCRY